MSSQSYHLCRHNSLPPTPTSDQPLPIPSSMMIWTDDQLMIIIILQVTTSIGGDTLMRAKMNQNPSKSYTNIIIYKFRLSSNH